MATHSRFLDRCAPPVALKALALALSAFAIALCAGTSLAPDSAQAVEYHTTCVGHGFVAGSSPTDGSFFSRVETGCGSGSRDCDIYNWGSFKGGLSTTTTTCNAWSNNYGSYTECASYAKVNFPGQFSQHNHTPDGYCASLRAAPIGQVEPLPEEPMPESPDTTPAGTAVIGATASDPDGGPDLAVRVYRSEAGMTCPESGRVQDGAYGTVWPDEGFVELEQAPAGACADLNEQPVGFAVSHRPADGDVPASATIFGSVSADVRAVSVTLEGKTQQLELVAGTFIVPVTLEVLDGAELVVTTTAGDTVPYAVPVPSDQ